MQAIVMTWLIVSELIILGILLDIPTFDAVVDDVQDLLPPSWRARLPRRRP